MSGSAIPWAALRFRGNNGVEQWIVPTSLIRPFRHPFAGWRRLTIPIRVSTTSEQILNIAFEQKAQPLRCIACDEEGYPSTRYALYDTPITISEFLAERLSAKLSKNKHCHKVSSAAAIPEDRLYRL